MTRNEDFLACKGLQLGYQDGHSPIHHDLEGDRATTLPNL